MYAIYEEVEQWCNWSSLEVKEQKKTMRVSSTTYIYDKSTVVTASDFGKLGILMSPETKNKHEGLFYCCIKKKRH